MTRPPYFGEPGRSHRPPHIDPHRQVVEGLAVAAAFFLIAANIAGYAIGVPVWLVWLLAFGLGVAVGPAWLALAGKRRR